MIDLGLARIGRLLQHGPPPVWRAIQVSGTNGKGSVCAYLSAMLHARGIPSARFTSPHIVDRWDCIVVNERIVAEAPFRAAEQAVLQRDRDEQIGATEFELLTATAFELFDAKLPKSSPSALAVIECGLGGGSDATSAMRADRAVTVITRIGLDHQGLLGNTVAEIATHKAGIMRPGVPCVVDPANCDDPDVRSVLEARAREVGATLVYPEATLLLNASRGSASDITHTSSADQLQKLEPHQLSNLACAYAAFRIATGQDGSADAKSTVDTAFLASVLQKLRWPGRLQKVDVGPLLRSVISSVESIPALLDGAHNAQSADVLGAYVDKHLRGEGDSKKPITWILAASHGKDLGEILRPLLRAEDRVAAVTFGAVDGMPWVQPAAPQTILDGATALGVNATTNQYTLTHASKEGRPRHDPQSLVSALQWATSAESGNTGGPIVIAGSLYLVSDTLRMLQKAGGETGLPL
ncbi:dihydrofolate synthetase fol3 [Ophiostoma piceae UAMH 11346]|uniref:Dihydrofolate synthetase fol3 n=1 Tax=Ophiostoma piceae (strain UAMH 11346) TaxID=1262450 RepID=S3CXR8_OPHP1|nr:dihydrofolate synthetase fol3 [Ophiostoma piceae UAMH 11346]